MAANARAAAPAFRAVRRYPRIIRVPALRGQYANNQRINALMPLGVTYLALMLRGTIAGVAATQAQLIANINRIRCIVDGDAKIDATPTELLAIFNFWNSRYGKPNVVDGTFRIELTRPWEQEIDAQDGPGWGMATNVPGGVGNFTLELEFTGAQTIDNFDVWAEVTDAAPLGRHLCIRRYVDNQAAAGDKVFSDFNMVVENSIYALHIDKGSVPEAAAPITDVALKVDQVDEIEKVKTGALEDMYVRYGLYKQTGFTHIPFDRRGRPLETLPMVAQDMRLTLTTGAALGNYNILSEQLEGVDPA